MKKIVLLIIVCLLLVLLPLLANADPSTVAQGSCGLNLTWILDDEGTLTITGTGEMDDFGSNSIPWSSYCDSITNVVLGDQITSIGSNAFRDLNITEIALPDTVTEIRGGAFYNCKKLDTIQFSDNLLSIGGNAFFRCSLQEAILPDTVTVIGSQAFGECVNLTTIKFPNNLQTINSLAFMGCEALTGIELPSSLATIEAYAFMGCRSITSITVPQSVTSIGEGAFRANTGLTSITLPFVGESRTATDSHALLGYIFGLGKVTSSYVQPDSEVPLTAQYSTGSSDYHDLQVYWYIIPQSLQHVTITDTHSIPAGAFKNCTNISVSIQCRINSIGADAFSGCRGVESLDFLDEITMIPNGAFSYCSDLQDATLPDTVTEIGSYAFSHCSNLQDVTLPDTVTGIGDYAFFGCENLSILHLSNQLQIIGDCAFLGCSALEEIELPSSLTTINARAFAGCTGITSITVPDSVTSIGNGVLEDAGVTSITLPFVGESRTATGHKATLGHVFGFCGTTKSEEEPPANYLSSTVQYRTIMNAEPAFYWYKIPQGLQSVTITDTQSISDYAFCNCSNISINIQSKINSIGIYSFSNCSRLETISFLDGTPIIPAYAFENCVSLQCAILPDTVTEIRGCAFYSCKKLETVHFSDNLLSIGGNAFFRCPLQEVILPDTVTVIGSQAFSECVNLTTVKFSNHLQIIKSHAFMGCEALTGIELPSSLTTIEAYAFMGCRSITSITVPNSVTSIGEGAFRANTGLTSITLPFVGETRTATDSQALLGYVFGLGKVTNTFVTPESEVPLTAQYSTGSGENHDLRVYWYIIPESLHHVTITDTDSIPAGAFNNCTNISVSIQSRIDSIGAGAFSYCRGVQSLDFLDGTTMIPDNTFNHCADLQDATLPDTVTAIGDYAFYGCANLSSLHLSDRLQTIGDCAFLACNTLKEIELPSELATIGISAFRGCTGITNITVPDSVTSIGNGAFMETGLISITLPFIGESRTATGKTAILGHIFGCYGSTSSPGVPETDLPVTCNYKTTDGAGTHYHWYYIPTTLKTVRITNASVISNSTFLNCTMLENVFLCEGIESLGDYAFDHCGINYLQIPDSVFNISDFAFNDHLILYMYKYSYAESWVQSHANPYYTIDDRHFSEIGGNISVPESETIIINDCYILQTNVTPLLDYIDIEYSSSDPNVATVDESGMISAVGTGTARISASIDDVISYCDITVSHYSEINGTITIPESVIMFIGDTCQLEATVSPAPHSSGLISYNSNNSNIVSVDSYGMMNTVDAGSARICVSIDDVSAYCDVTVVSQMITELRFEDDVLIPVSYTAQADNLVYLPENAGTSFEWSIENSTFATVDGNGFITGNYVGGTTITVTDRFSGLSATANLRVCPPVLSVSLNSQELTLLSGDTFDLDATIQMRNLTCTDRLVQYESENPAIVEIDKKTGLCTAITAGTARVTVSSANGKTDSCLITVTPLNILNLPDHTQQIESGAFVGLPNVNMIRIPPDVISIAPDAFDKQIILLVPAGSQWVEWAETNGYTAQEDMNP